MTAIQRVNSPAGVSLMIASAVLFGVIFYLAGIVNVPTENVVAWRNIITTACYAAVLCVPRARAALKRHLKVVRAQRGGWAIVLLLSCIITVQLWLFIWGPAQGQALDVALGYLLLPLVLVVAGRFVFHDQMSKVQWVAVLMALLAVLGKIAVSGGVAWPVLVVSLGYTFYFMLRRHTGFDAAPGFGLEMAVMSPVMIAVVLTQPVASVTAPDVLGLVLIGVLGTLAMVMYLGASVRLSMPMFGLLSYIEPVLLMVVALLLGELLTGVDAFVYGLLAAALVLLSIDGFWRSRPR